MLLLDRFLHSSWFCFCIPIRAGFVLITVLSFILSGTISVIVWFEIHNSYQLTLHQRVAFVLAGIVESLLCLASMFGFIGVVARKQLFVMIYTYFLYVHFIINVIVGIYFLVTARASNRDQLVNYCADVFDGTSTGSSCTRLLSVSTYVFIAIVAALLLLELYGVLIATRYVYRLRKQKKDGRSRRLGYFHALSQPETFSTRHSRASDDIELLHGPSDHGHDPESAVVDVRAPAYTPVSTHDHDLPRVPASPSFPPDKPSSGRVRALPPRPIILSPVITRASDDDADWPDELDNPYETMGERTPQRLDSEDGMTTHSAMMDHATFMQTVFTRPAV